MKDFTSYPRIKEEEEEEANTVAVSLDANDMIEGKPTTDRCEGCDEELAPGAGTRCPFCASYAA